jgi:hypothetical protein
MAQWLLTHQPALIATIVINGLTLAILIVGIAFTPRAQELER